MGEGDYTLLMLDKQLIIVTYYCFCLTVPIYTHDNRLYFLAEGFLLFLAYFFFKCERSAWT